MAYRLYVHNVKIIAVKPESGCVICLPRISWWWVFREKSVPIKLTPIDRCMILDREFGSVTRLKQLLQGLNGKADIGHIELAMGDQDIALLVRENCKIICR